MSTQKSTRLDPNRWTWNRVRKEINFILFNPLQLPSGGATAPLAGFFLLTQFDPSDFAANRFGQLRDEFNLARIFIWRGQLPHVRLQLLGQRLRRLVPWCQHDKRFDDRATHFIRARHYGRLGHGVVLDQRALHLEWPDAISSTNDDVVGPADKPKIAVFIPDAAITGDVPLALERVLRLLRFLP